MRLRDDVTVEKAGDRYWLIPFAGAAAAHVRSFELNDFSSFLLRQLSFEITDRALIELSADYTGESISDIASDVHEFLDELSGSGLIAEDSVYYYTPSICFNIAGIHLASDCDRRYISDALMDFKCDLFASSDIDLYFTMKEGISGKDSRCRHIFSTSEFTLSETDAAYIFSYSGFRYLTETVITKDCGGADLYIRNDSDNARDMQDEIFIALRSAFLLAALKDRKIAIHSCVCADEYGAFLLSAPSGGGKSTLSQLIQQYHSISILNGDLGLIGTEDKETYVYGIPWCGTSGIYTTGKMRLDSAAFLHKATENRIDGISAGDHAMTFMNRIISPAWNKNMLEARIRSAMIIVNKIRLYEYFFKNDKEAGKIFYERRIADNTCL